MRIALKYPVLQRPDISSVSCRIAPERYGACSDLYGLKTTTDTDIDPTASVMSEGNVWLVAAIGGAALAAAAVSVFLVKKKRSVS